MKLWELGEEEIPDFVFPLGELSAEEWAAFGFDGLTDESHASFVWRASPFVDVAGGTGADDVFPGVFAAATFRHDMIEAELGGAVADAAVLAAMSIA